MTRPVGSIRRKGKRWELRWSELDPITGKPERRSKLVFAASQRDATRKLHAAIDARPTADLTVEALCRRWLDHSSPRKVRRTVQSQEQVIRCHIVPAFGATRARDLKPRQGRCWPSRPGWVTPNRRRR